MSGPNKRKMNDGYEPSSPDPIPKRKTEKVGQRGVTLHSAMFSHQAKPKYPLTAEQLAPTPQGPHTTSFKKNSTMIEAAAKQGELSELRKSLAPPIGPHAQTALDKVEKKRPYRVQAWKDYHLARQNSLDEHELQYQERVKLQPPGSAPLPNTPEHAASLAAATDASPYSTTHWQSTKPANKNHTKAKNEKGKTYSEAVDINAVKKGFGKDEELHKEVEEVLDKRKEHAKKYLPPGKA